MEVHTRSFGVQIVSAVKVRPEPRNDLLAVGEMTESCICNWKTMLKMSVLHLSVDLKGCQALSDGRQSRREIIKE